MIKVYRFLFKFILILFSFVPFLITIFILFIIHKIFEKPPFFFIQNRVGVNKKVFKIIKIKTMNKNKISRFSAFLRKTKLDEIPQFISYIKGDLNLIGPRPLLEEYNKFYKKSEEIRFSIKPGITGLSQVKSNSKTTWDTRLRWDIIYIKKKSLRLDIYIFFSTVRLLFFYTFYKKNNLDNFVRLDVVRKMNDDL